RPDRAVARIWPHAPGAGEALVGAPAEQERVGALVDVLHGRPGFIVEVGPSAALEKAALVLFRPAGPLHHPINGDLRGGRELHVETSLRSEMRQILFHLPHARLSQRGVTSRRPWSGRSGRRARPNRPSTSGGLCCRSRRAPRSTPRARCPARTGSGTSPASAIRC